VYFFPQVLAITIIAVLWQYVYNPRQGLLNGFLSSVGLVSKDAPPAWLSDPRTAFWCVLAVLVWANVGFYVVLFSAALQAVPREIYEAAMVDGAGQNATFWRMTVPLLWDTLQVAWVYLAIAALDGFALVNVMTGGGPNHETEVAGQTIYTAAFGDFKFGYASAMAVVLFLITMTVAALAFKLSRRDRVEF
jgi:N-acetylglucosamine transport system permease protein